MNTRFLSSVSTKCRNTLRARRITLFFLFLPLNAVLADDAADTYKTAGGADAWLVLYKTISPDLQDAFRAVNRFAVADGRERLADELISGSRDEISEPFNPYARFEGMSVAEIIIAAREPALAYHQELIAEFSRQIDTCSDCSEYSLFELEEQLRNVEEDSAALKRFASR